MHIVEQMRKEKDDAVSYVCNEQNIIINYMYKRK